MKKEKANLALRIGFGVAGALGLAGLCGCTEEAILGNAAMAGISTNPRVVANPQASAWASAFSAGTQAQLNSINAEKMGTTVNVNVSGQNNTNVPRVYNHVGKASYREISKFNIKTTNYPTNNKTVYFEGEVLEEDDYGFIVRVSSDQVYSLPKTQVVEYINRQNIPRVYKHADKTSYRKTVRFNIRTTNDPTNNKTVPFEGEVLEEDDEGFTVRVSTGQVYSLPKTQVVNKVAEYWIDK